MVHVDLAGMLVFGLRPKFLAALPFEVTEGQIRVLFQIPDHGLTGQKYGAFLKGLFSLGKFWVLFAIFVKRIGVYVCVKTGFCIRTAN